MTALGFKMKADTLYFIPLGGCGEFGMNMSLYGFNGKWIMVDCGMGFADDTVPGVDILLPDPEFAQKLGTDLLGIIITHGHEDHIGALQHIWPRLKAPVYATPFTAERIMDDFSETPWGGQAKLHVIAEDGKIDLAPFSIQTINMAHSIPEARGLAITAGGGTVFHTGDWKIDHDPIEGDVTDEAALKALGDKGLWAVIGDSTNSAVPGVSGSEREVEKNLTEMFREFKNQIIISCFSTSVSRLHSIYTAAKKNGRQVALVGRSLWSVDDAARKTGYLKNVPDFLEAEEAAFLPLSRIVYVCTGSQGEPRAALTRVSNDDHKDVRVDEGDTVIFSSRIIPGNERAVERVKNRFLGLGVEVITGHDAPIHVSGHPCREELKQLYSWTKPVSVIPVHGERIQLERHADLAKECGVQHTEVPTNGDVFEITAQGVKKVAAVKAGILAIEGNRIVPFDHEAILTRKRMMWNGSAIVTVVVDDKGKLLAPVRITALGLLDEENDIDKGHLEDVENLVTEKLNELPAAERKNDAVLSEAVRVTARRYFQDIFDRKPQTRVHLIRV